MDTYNAILSRRSIRRFQQKKINPELLKKMTNAAKLYEKTPMAMRLRELQTLAEISREGNLIIVPGGDIGRVAGIAKAVNQKTK